jgi:hypothetical protein
MIAPPHRYLVPSLLLGLSVVLAALPADAQTPSGDLPYGHRYLVFSTAYRATDAAGNSGNFIVLGQYDFLNDHSARLSYSFYDARKNLRGSNTTHRHPRLIPATAASPGPIQIPSHALAEQVRGVWAVDRGQGIVRIYFGKLVHEWSLRDQASSLFVPRGNYINADNGSHTVNGWTYSDTRGYAYLTDQVDLPRKLTRDDLWPDYKGEIQTMAPNRGQQVPWSQRASDLHVGRYVPSADGDVLGYKVASRWVNTPTLVFSTILLNHAPSSKLILYINGGHDFNHNGVFDEPGHTIHLFGVYDGAKVSQLVYAEHSYQEAGAPILSVGHYYVARK